MTEARTNGDNAKLSAVLSQATHRLERDSLRPIPPPQSREAVRRQVIEVAAWTALDSDGDVLFATRSKKRKSTSEDTSVSTTSVTPSATQPPKAKKRRLILAPNAELVADDIKTEASTLLPDVVSFAHNIPTAEENNQDINIASNAKHTTIFEDRSDDEGYQTGGVRSPVSTLSTSDDENELVRQLAQVQQQVLSQFLPPIPVTTKRNEKDEKREKEQRDVEELYAKRSKMLREQIQAGDQHLNRFSAAFFDDDSSPEPLRVEQPRLLRDTLDSMSNTPVSHACLRRQQLSSFDLPGDDVSIRRGDTRLHTVESQSRPRQQMTPFKRHSIDSASSGHERLLDIAQGVDTRPTASCTLPKHASGLHPASRRAANTWRTQSRHNERNTTPGAGVLLNDTACETRLWEFQNGRSKIVSQPSPSQGDCGLEPLLDGIPDSGLDPGKAHPEKSVINKNSQPSAIVALQQQRMKDDELAFVPLGELADIDVGDFEAFKAERKRLRELQSDLNLIQETYIEMARIYYHRYFEASEIDHQLEAEKFVVHVVKNQLPGKGCRGSMTRVRDAFRRRVQAKLVYALTSEDEIDIAYQELLTKHWADKIEDVLRKLVKSLHDLEAARQLKQEENKKLKSKLRDAKKSEKRRQERDPKKQVRFAAAAAAAPNKRVKLNKTDREKKRLQDLSSTYEADRALRENAAQATELQDTESESVISEEDADGVGFVQGGYQSTTCTGMMAQAAYHGNNDDNVLIVEEHQDMDEVNAIEDARQHDQSRAVGGQAFDEKLLLENRLAAITRREAEAKKAQHEEVQFDDLEVDVSDTETSESEDDDDDDDIDKEVFQYAVNGEFYGLEDRYKEGSEYTFKQYYNRDRAEEVVRTIISQLQRKYALQHGCSGDLNTSFGPEGMTRQELILGDSFAAKLWIKKRLVPVAKVNARKARQMAALNVRTHWYVDWEKTIETTTIKPAGASISKTADEDDLFGTSTPEPDITEVTTHTERPEIAELEVFNNAFQANMRAKDVYMAWFTEFVPAHERPSMAYPHYDGQLRLVHDGLQDEVDSAIEGVGVGPWEDEFSRPRVVDDDGLGTTTHVKERLRVVVRQMNVKGPRN